MVASGTSIFEASTMQTTKSLRVSLNYGPHRTSQGQYTETILCDSKRRPYRVALKLIAALALILILMLFAGNEVDFVYKGF